VTTCAVTTSAGTVKYEASPGRSCATGHGLGGEFATTTSSIALTGLLMGSRSPMLPGRWGTTSGGPTRRVG
jgi:hypothetical protein